MQLEKRCDDLDDAMRLLAQHHRDLKLAFNQLLANHLEATDTTGRVLADVVSVLDALDYAVDEVQRPEARTALARLLTMVEEDEPETADNDG